MGLADRDYQRQPEPGGGRSFSANLTPVVKWLLIANIGVFFLDYVFLASVDALKSPYSDYPPLLRWGAFAVESALMEMRLWEFLSFQFLHGSLGHVLFNCIGLYFFGPWMERWWGSRKFLVFYLLCGAAGAAFFTILMVLGVLPGDFRTPMVGASAGIYGIFMGVAIIAPNMRVALLFPPIELSMRQLAIGLLVISAGAIVLSWGGNEGGEAGHMGGAILGFLLVRHPRLLGGGGLEIVPPRVFRTRHQAKLRPRSEAHMAEDDEVDRILDKISRDGFQSLTDAEREILSKAAERNQPR